MVLDAPRQSETVNVMLVHVSTAVGSRMVLRGSLITDPVPISDVKSSGWELREFCCVPAKSPNPHNYAKTII